MNEPITNAGAATVWAVCLALAGLLAALVAACSTEEK